MKSKPIYCALLALSLASVSRAESPKSPSEVVSSLGAVEKATGKDALRKARAVIELGKTATAADVDAVSSFLRRSGRRSRGRSRGTWCRSADE